MRTLVFRLAIAVLALAAASCEKAADPLAEAKARCDDRAVEAAERASACTQVLDGGKLQGPERAVALTHRGEAQIASGATTPALRDFEAARALDSSNLDAAYGQASILIDSGQLDRAQPLVQQMVGAQYKLVQSQYMAGRIALARGEYQNAITAFDASLAQDSGFAPALALRGRAKESLGQDADARADYDAAIARDASAANALAWRCWLKLRAKPIVDADARPDAEAAVHADPHVVEGQTCLGILNLRAGEWADAQSAFDAVLTFQPGNPVALFGRGVARRRGGDDKGADDMNQAHEFDPHVREFFFALGVTTY